MEGQSQREETQELDQLKAEGWEVVANCTRGFAVERVAHYRKEGKDVRVIQAEVFGNVLILTKEMAMLTRQEMKVGMRVMLPDATMRGSITSITDERLAVHFDGTSMPMTYEWEHANFLVKEE